MRYAPIFLSELEKSAIEVTRQFVDREILPFRHLIEDDREEKILKQVLAKLKAMHFFDVSLPSPFTAEPTVLTGCVVAEELARGDCGIALINSVSQWALTPAVRSGNKVIVKAYQALLKKSEPPYACFAMTEPDSGCDVENVDDMHGQTIKTIAKKDGTEWVINGAKRFPSGAGVSDLYCVVCQTETKKQEEGIVLLYVPAKTPGIRYGAFEKKAGLRADKNCDIFFDDVRVPLGYQASKSGGDAALLKYNVIIGRVTSAAMAVGCAQGALDEAMSYAAQRIVGGKPMNTHSITRGIIADMITGIETARAHYLQTASSIVNQEAYGLSDEKLLACASISKNHATDVANMVTNRAMELMGSYGYMRDYHVEKYWRDVKIIQLWLGGKQLGQLDIARQFAKRT